MKSSVTKMKESPANFFESYDVPFELRKLSIRHEREQANVWDLCVSYAFAKGLKDKGYNASVLRFVDGKVHPEDLKMLGSFAFKFCPTLSLQSSQIQSI